MISLNQAIAAHQAGDMAEAERLYQKILDDDPHHPDACALLGVVIGARGDFDRAIALAEKAVTLDPNAGILYCHLGTIYMAAQKLPEAITAFSRAITLQPQTAQIHYNYANALRANENWPAAIVEYCEAIRLDPKFLDAYNNLALSLTHIEHYAEACKMAEKAVMLDPDYGPGWLTLCNVFEKLKEHEAAISAGQRAAALMPDNHYPWFGLGVALNRLDRHEEAIEAYRKALAIEPKRADIWDNLGQTYQSLNRLEEAEQIYRKCIEIAGQIIVDEDRREIDENEYGNRHWHLALMELLRGNYKAGFARYRARVKEIPELKRPSLNVPLWRGEHLIGKTLLVCDEQGYGDTLMLARFLPPLRARGVKIIASVHPVLRPLFENWAGADHVIVHGEKFPPCDFYCSFFDLPHRLGATLENLPREVPYMPVLSPDDTRFLTSDRPKIGVVWGGSPLHKNDEKRSVPLAIFAELFSLSGFSFYSFNRDLKPGDADLLPNYRVENLAPLLTDFGVAARLIAQMDLVISCDTATAHLAGALGKKLFVLLPFAPDWRWLTGRSDSPWYPIARLFRQPRIGDWRSVIAEVKAALQKI